MANTRQRKSLIPQFPPNCPCSKFITKYRQHTEAVANFLNLQLWDSIEPAWKSFWAEIPPEEKDLISSPASMDYLEVVDKTVYNVYVDILVPDVFQLISSILTKQIRNFAKHIEDWMTDAIVNFPEHFGHARVDMVTYLAQKLRRFTSLNHLSQAARAVLKNPPHIAQMQADYNRVDFLSIKEQMIWACEGCNEEAMTKLEGKFKDFLTSGCTLEDWANWLQLVVRQSIQRSKNKEEFKNLAHDLLLKWSFLSSLVIRDLTLRSASSFGMFHLMRLLCDEYMYYLVEIALFTGKCPTIEHLPGGGPERKEISPIDATSVKREFDEDDDGEQVMKRSNV